jgi:competence protein ComEC
MIDVGQGNAFAVRTAKGHWVLFDAGRAWKGGDDGRATIVPYIAHRGGSLAAFVLTSARSDNVGGAASVVRALHPRMFYDGATGIASGPYLAALQAVRRSGTIWRPICAGDSLTVDEATIRFLSPDPAPANGRGAGRSNVMAVVRIGRVRILLAADATSADERRLVARAPQSLRADALQVARHGSAAANAPEFLRAVSPAVALVSVGTMGSYGDPSPSVIQDLSRCGAEVMRTDRLSTVVLSTDGRTLHVAAAGDSWGVPLTPPPTLPPP